MCVIRILALDLSTKNTGFAVFTDKTLTDYGCISKSSKDVVKRILDVTKDIHLVLDKYPDVEQIIIEEVRPENTQYGVGNLHTHKVLMWLQAAIIFMLYNFYPKIEIQYLLPSEWRARCNIHTGRGIKRKELKEADIAFVQKTYNITVNDDIADAIGIGHAYVYNVQPKAQVSDEMLNWD